METIIHAQARAAGKTMARGEVLVKALKLKVQNLVETKQAQQEFRLLHELTGQVLYYVANSYARLGLVTSKQGDTVSTHIKPIIVVSNPMIQKPLTFTAKYAELAAKKYSSGTYKEPFRIIACEEWLRDREAKLNDGIALFSKYMLEQKILTQEELSVIVNLKVTT